MSKRFIIFGIMLFLILGYLFFRAYSYSNFQETPQNIEHQDFKQDEQDESQIKDSNMNNVHWGSFSFQELSYSSKESVPVLIYAEEIKIEETVTRIYLTYQLWRKIGNKEPERLMEVGNKEEIPINYYLHPNKRYLFVNLETKLQVLDLETKETYQFFTPNKQVESIVFSPDGDQVFIWDQRYASQDDEYYVHLLNLRSKEHKIIKQGRFNQDFVGVGAGFYGMIWRKDNKIVLGSPGGEAAGLWYYDLDLNTAINVNNRMTDSISKSGRLMIQSNSWIKDICNDFSQSATNGYDIIDPVTEEKKGIIKASKNDIPFVTFSPDDKEVLYQEFVIKNKKEDCDKNIKKYYIKAGISGNYIVQLSENEYYETLKRWNVNNLGFEFIHKEDKNVITFRGKPIISSEKEFRVIVQFYSS